jgi:hypothetical protein
MIVGVDAYEVMGDVYVRIRAIPSLGEGTVGESRTLLDRYFQPDDSWTGTERVLRCVREAVALALDVVSIDAEGPPF